VAGALHAFHGEPDVEMVCPVGYPLGPFDWSVDVVVVERKLWLVGFGGGRAALLLFFFYFFGAPAGPGFWTRMIRVLCPASPGF
jgi:hypothetical protein